MNFVKKILPYGTIGLLPYIALAQSDTQVDRIIVNTTDVLDRLIPILIIIATIVFIWGVIQYITAGADEEKRAGARNLIIYALIGIFVIIAVFGIVKLLQDFFGVGGVTQPTRPGLLR
jgi:TRAP-type C4-dicarboxylate transport system permease small subunit